MLEIKVLKSTADKAILLKQVDLESHIDFFHRDVVGHREYIAAIGDNKIVGLVGFVGSSIWLPGAIGVAFISTHAHYRNRGVASQLVTALFEQARLRGTSIANTSYEELGLKYLKPVMQRIARSYADVRFVERD